MLETLSGTSVFLPALALLLACLQLLTLIAHAKSRRHNPFNKPILKRALFAGAVLAIALSLHYLQFRLFGILLPKDRTALFVVPLTLVAFGALSAAVPRDSWGRILHFLALSLLWLAAVYFAGSLRLLYFKEWRYDAEVKTAYAEIRALNREYGIRRFASGWMYVATLNFNRRYYKDEKSIDPFEASSTYAAGQPAYVLYLPETRAFIERNKLKLVFTGGISDIAIAIPEPVRKPLKKDQ